MQAHFEAGMFPVFGKGKAQPADGKKFFDFFPVYADVLREVYRSMPACKGTGTRALLRAVEGRVQQGRLYGGQAGIGLGHAHVHGAVHKLGRPGDLHRTAVQGARTHAHVQK